MIYSIPRTCSCCPAHAVKIPDDTPERERMRVAVVAAAQRRANLDGAYLGGAYLGGANLGGAYLGRAYLDGANLGGAYLGRAYLDGAYLGGAYLGRAYLDGAYLGGANLGGAYLPSPTMVLLASWGSLSDALVADLMVYDATCHPDPTAFDRWASGGACPYDGVRVQRAAQFTERRELWGKGAVCRPYDLMVRVLAEKCPAWSEEKQAEFAASMRRLAGTTTGDDR